MLDQVAVQNFFQEIDNLWIQPELKRRKSEGTLANDFRIRECLIRLPEGRPPIVEFNDEFGWYVEHPELAPGIEMEAGQTVYLYDVIKLGKVLPPMVDDKPVAFIYLYWTGFSYQAVFDASPNDPEFDQAAYEFQLGETISQHLNLKMIERVVRITKNVQPKLRQIGLWPATSLLPYPLSKIAERVENGANDDARKVLIEYCTPAFIHNLVGTWTPISVFNSRKELFAQAVNAHEKRWFQLSINALVPQIEGIVSDWLYSTIYGDDNKRNIKTKFDDFRSTIEKVPEFYWLYREALSAIVEFICADKDGGPLKTFWNWLERIDSTFPNRHVISHGRYDEDVFTEENSIKLFLLLDTICQFMMFYEVRVLGKNLGQENQVNE